MENVNALAFATELSKKFREACDNLRANGLDPTKDGVTLSYGAMLALCDSIEHLERERDAAVEDIRKAAWCCCHVCKHYYQPDPNVRTHSCKKYGDFDKHDFIADDGSIFCGAMEWRGVQEVE